MTSLNQFLFKLAGSSILPKPTAVARMMGSHIPKPGKLPLISAAYKDAVLPPVSAASKALLGGAAAGNGAIDGAITGIGQAAATIAPKAIKAASAAFFAELEELAPDLLDKVAEADVEELIKAALGMPNFAGMGQALKGGLASVGKSVGGALQGARGAVANVAGKISPTLNKPVMQAAQQGAHALQHSPNSFAQGVGNILHHKVQTPGKAFLAAANPVGTAAEALAGGAGNAASKGLATAGGRLQQAAGAGDAIARQGRAMTPKGRLLNAAESVGGRMQQAFSPGGTGHNVLTKHVPLAAELGGAVGAGMALHAPVGLAGVAGKMGLLGAGKAVPALGAALEHAPHAVDAIAQKATPALKGIGHAVHHAAEDLVGTHGSGVAGRVLGRGAQQAAQAGQSMLPEAAHSIAPAAGAALSMIPRAPKLPTF